MMELQPLYSAEEMRDLEARAIDGLRLPALVLMERAGVAAAAEIIRRYPGADAATILCGAGNNGGDGFVVARHLHAAGWAVEVFLTGVSGKLKDDARINFEVVRRMGVPVHEKVAPARLKRGVRRADVVVDALLGTGFTGMPRPGAAALIEAVDAAGGAVAALDVPSGIDSSTGRVEGVAARADVTISFHAAKLGLMVSPGRRYRGDVVVVPIGIPPQIETADRGGSGNSERARSGAAGRMPSPPSTRQGLCWCWAARRDSPEPRRWRPWPRCERVPASPGWARRQRCATGSRARTTR